MKSKRKIYTGFQLASAVLMILALLWLTVSLPFVYASQQELAKLEKTTHHGSPLAGAEEEAANCFNNGGTEEKAPNTSTSFSEEYLHDHHKTDYFFSIIAKYYSRQNAGTYIAFHGELLVPPPDAA